MNFLIIELEPRAIVIKMRTTCLKRLLHLARLGYRLNFISKPIYKNCDTSYLNLEDEYVFAMCSSIVESEDSRERLAFQQLQARAASR